MTIHAWENVKVQTIIGRCDTTESKHGKGKGKIVTKQVSWRLGVKRGNGT